MAIAFVFIAGVIGIFRARNPQIIGRRLVLPHDLARRCQQARLKLGRIIIRLLTI